MSSPSVDDPATYRAAAEPIRIINLPTNSHGMDKRLLALGAKNWLQSTIKTVGSPSPAYQLIKLLVGSWKPQWP